MEGFSQEQIDEVNAAMNNTDKAPNARLAMLLSILVRDGIAHFLENIPVDAFVVDPENRSKVMLDWFAAHQKVVAIYKSGASEAALGYKPMDGADAGELLQVKSVAFELPPAGSKEKTVILDAMRKLVASSSQGETLLSPPVAI